MDFKIGAINWDAALPRDTYFGRWAAQSLSAPQFRHRVPYFARIADGAVQFPPRSQADFDRELTYAADAGIDYFAYCRYTDTVLDHPQNEVERTAGWHELNFASHMHRRSALRSRIGYCLILRPSKMNDADFAALPDELAADCYVKLDGRPLVYIFGGEPGDLLPGRLRLRDVMRRRGAPEPYFVVLGCNLHTAGLAEADAVSHYAICPTDCARYGDLAQRVMDANLDAARTGLPVIPTFSTGWDPSPRILSPVPWTSYKPGAYSEAAPDELTAALVQFAEFTAAHRDAFPTGHILTFAWNEFEEGGWLCPTRRADGTPNTARLDAFAHALRDIRL